MNFIEATYLLSSKRRFNPEKLVNDYLERFFGKVEDKYRPKLYEVDDFYDSDFKLFKALVKVRFPVLLFNHELYSIISMVYGEIVIPENVKLVGVDFPASFIDHFNGPNYGMKTIRELLNQHHRPLLSISLKGLNGIKKEKYYEILEYLAEQSIDIVREEEIFFDDTFCPYEDRLNKAFKLFNKNNILFIPMLSGNLNEIKQKIHLGKKYNVKIFSLNLFPLGFQILQDLSSEFKVGFLVNPGYPSYFYEKDLFGIEPNILFGRFLRLSGADMILIPSPYNSKTVPHYRSVEIANSLLERFEDIKPSLPVVYGYINPEDIFTIFEDFGNNIVIDIGFNWDDKRKITKYISAVKCLSEGIPPDKCEGLS